MSERVRRRKPQPFRPSGFSESAEQRLNALQNSAREAAARPKRQPVEMDWDKCIARLHVMLDALEN